MLKKQLTGIFLKNVTLRTSSFSKFEKSLQEHAFL